MFRICRVFIFLALVAGLRVAAQPVISAGTDFWVAFQPNTDGQNFILVINSDFACTGHISSVYNTFSQDFTVTPGTGTEITLPGYFCLAYGITDKGIHIVTDFPVSVVCHNYSHLPLTADSYLALPSESLGTDYYVMSVHGEAANGAGSNLSVISTADGNNITIFNRGTSLTEQVVLNRGQVYMANAINKDITGSRVQSDYPVAVFGANIVTSIPAGCVAADMVVEEMLPVTAWGKDFYTVSLAGRELDGDYFRILAKDNLTVIKINDVTVATLNSGRFFETDLSGNNHIISSAPVTVAQFAKSYACAGSNGKGDPLMMLVPPRQQYATEFMLSTISYFEDWVNIVASPNAVGKIYQDGTLISASAFSPVGTDGYHAARLPITRGTHIFTGTDPFQVFSYGWGNAISYGNPAGGSLSNLASATHLTLSPDSASGILNFTTLCFTATVTDDFGVPVMGIMVDFKVHGLGDILKSMFTDSLGHAVFCYGRTGNIPGMDSLVAEVGDVRSNTSRAWWKLCMQPLNGGTIGHSQSSCTAFIPQPLLNITGPSGYTGKTEYKWQISIIDSTSGFSDIPGTDSSAYMPGLVTQSTWFRRVVKVSCDSLWPSSGVSNAVVMQISSQFTPEVILGSDSLYCEGVMKTVTAEGIHGGSDPAYQWILNGMPAGSDTSSFSWIPSPGDSIRCIFTSSLTCVTVNPVTSRVVVINPDLSHPAGVSLSAIPYPSCPGEPVTVTATPLNGGSGPSMAWYVNGIATGNNSPQFSFIPGDGDAVTCIMTSTLGCVSGNPVVSAPLPMIVRAPVAKFSVTPADTALSAALITLHDESSGSTGCQVDWGDGTVTGCDTILHRYLQTGIFIVWEKVRNNAGCRDSSYEQVIVRPLPNDYPENNYFIPDSFTPDGDGLNDFFRFPYNGVKDFNLIIFNRNGQEIFSSSDPTQGWNGQFEGKPCPEDVYAYKLIFTDSASGEQHHYHGTLLLIRKK